MISKYTVEKVNSVPIERIAQLLGLEVNRHRAICPFHPDTHPSLMFKPQKNIYRCFVCGKGGHGVGLVMEKEGLKYQDAVRWIASQEHILVKEDEDSAFNNQKTGMELEEIFSPKEVKYTLDSQLVESRRSNNNEFCEAVVQTRILTREQMQRAASLYRTGSTLTDRGIIFWQIDEQQRVRDGKVMHYLVNAHRNREIKPNFISWLMKNKGQDAYRLPAEWEATRCLFGLHLLGVVPQEEIMGVAIVESEKTAFICSQLLAERRFLWMATGGLQSLKPELLLPLKGHRIILFPDTDPQGQTYAQWCGTARRAQQLLSQPIYVSDFLERVASGEQKKEKIDIADFFQGQCP